MADSNLPISVLEEGSAPLVQPNAEVDVPQIETPTLKEGKQQSSFNIKGFRSEIKSNGVLRNNQFVVVFTPPLGMNTSFTRDSREFDEIKNADPETGQVPEGEDPEKEKIIESFDDTRFLSLRCENATLPGVNFFTTDNIRRYGYGQIERRPYLPQFNPITLTFTADANGKVLKYFYEWSNLISNHDVFKNGYHGATGGQKPYFLNWKDEYSCKKMNIWIYNENLKQVAQCSLRDAYPLTISDTSLAWGSQDDYVRFSVTMQYTDIALNFASVGNSVGGESVLQDANEIVVTAPRKKTSGLERLFKSKINDLEEKVVNKVLNIF